MDRETIIRDWVEPPKIQKRLIFLSRMISLFKYLYAIDENPKLLAELNRFAGSFTDGISDLTRWKEEYPLTKIEDLFRMPSSRFFELHPYFSLCQLMHARERIFFEWRYLDNPYIEY